MLDCRSHVFETSPGSARRSGKAAPFNGKKGGPALGVGGLLITKRVKSSRDPLVERLQGSGSEVKGDARTTCVERREARGRSRPAQRVEKLYLIGRGTNIIFTQTFFAGREKGKLGGGSRAEQGRRRDPRAAYAPSICDNLGNGKAWLSRLGQKGLNQKQEKKAL